MQKRTVALAIAGLAAVAGLANAAYVLCESDLTSTCWDCYAINMPYDFETENVVWYSEEPPPPVQYSTSVLGSHAECPFWNGLGWSRMFWVRAVKRLDATGAVVSDAVGYLNCPGGAWVSTDKPGVPTLAERRTP
jgi:hypothetical protein